MTGTGMTSPQVAPQRTRWIHRALRRTPMRIVAAALGLLLTLTACSGDSAPDETTAAERIATNINSLFGTNADFYDRVRAVLVIQDGEPLVEEYYDSDASQTLNVFSVTKSVISTLIGIAISEGKLRLDQSLDELLPTYGRQMSPKVAAITLEQLLTMTSGLPEDEATLTFGSKPDWVEAILAEPLGAAPGEDLSLLKRRFSSVVGHPHRGGG